RRILAVSFDVSGQRMFSHGETRRFVEVVDFVQHSCRALCDEDNPSPQSSPFSKGRGGRNLRAKAALLETCACDLRLAPFRGEDLGQGQYARRFIEEISRLGLRLRSK